MWLSSSASPRVPGGVERGRSMIERHTEHTTQPETAHAMSELGSLQLQLARNH